jgi:hypothetical protein
MKFVGNCWSFSEPMVRSSLGQAITTSKLPDQAAQRGVSLRFLEERRAGAWIF